MEKILQRNSKSFAIEFHRVFEGIFLNIAEKGRGNSRAKLEEDLENFFHWFPSCLRREKSIFNLKKKPDNCPAFFIGGGENRTLVLSQLCINVYMRSTSDSSYNI